MRPDGSELRLLTTALDRQSTPYPDHREPAWVGDRIVFSVEDGGNLHLYSVPADGSAAPELLLGGERIVPSWDVHGDRIAFTASTHTSLRELYVRDGDGERKVTDLTSSFAELRDAERFTAISKDGTEVDAWIVRPAGFEPGKRIRCSSACTAARSRSTRPASSTSSRCTRARATRCCSRTRAAAPATRRSGGARSAARSTAAPAGGRSTSRT